MFLVPFQLFKHISQGIKAIVAEETDSDDDTETNDDVDGLILVMKNRYI